MADLVRDWEAEASRAEAAGTRVVLLRTGLIMSRRGGAFGRRLLPLFKAGLGGPIGGGKHWWPWITLLDEVRAIEFCLTNPDLTGPVNSGGPAPARNADVTRALAAALHRPAVLPVPRFALRIAVGGFASEIVASDRMLPTKLLDAGFHFTHPDLPTACHWLTGD